MTQTLADRVTVLRSRRAGVLPVSSFGALLRNWRARRRVSQLDLALIAGLSQRHVSFLESGRAGPSRLTIDRIGDALSIPWSDRDRLHLAAGYAPQQSSQPWTNDVCKAVDESIAFILERHNPYPALSVDRLWNLKSANAGAAKLFTAIGGRPERNIVRLMLDPECFRPFLVNWRDVAGRLLSLIELEVARRLEDQEGDKLLQELTALQGVGGLPSVTNISTGPALTLHFNIHGEQLRLFSMVAVIGLTADSTLDDIKLETLLPVDHATKVWFNK